MKYIKIAANAAIRWTLIYFAWQGVVGASNMLAVMGVVYCILLVATLGLLINGNAVNPCKINANLLSAEILVLAWLGWFWLATAWFAGVLSFTAFKNKEGAK